MKELEQYLGATYSDSCHPDIMTETVATFPNPEMHRITYFGKERPKIDGEMTYLEKNNNDEALQIRYAQDIQSHLVQTNKQL